MGQQHSIHRIPKDLLDEMIEMLRDRAWTQAAIVEVINGKAGKRVITKSARSRFVAQMDREAKKKKTPHDSLERIAAALERISLQHEQIQPS
jgi:hypothetical protein